MFIDVAIRKILVAWHMLSLTVWVQKIPPSHGTYDKFHPFKFRHGGQVSSYQPDPAAWRYFLCLCIYLGRPLGYTSFLHKNEQILKLHKFLIVRIFQDMPRNKQISSHLSFFVYNGPGFTCV